MEGVASSHGHRPDGPWVFDEEVARIFDDMLRRSIPPLETMRELVFAVGNRFVQPDTFVVDIGCSRGDALAPFVDAFGGTVRFVGVDASLPMLTECRTRFREQINAGTLTLLDLDLGSECPRIDRKRLSLQGVLVPVTAAGNEQLLAGAGFADIECFWRSLNFAAWVAVKPPAT